MIASRDNKKLTSYRINPLTIERLKTKAKIDNVSVNTLVDSILSEYTKDVRTPEEVEEERKRTSEFLGACVGIWAGAEYDTVEDAVNECRTFREITEL